MRFSLFFELICSMGTYKFIYLNSLWAANSSAVDRLALNLRQLHTLILWRLHLEQPDVSSLSQTNHTLVYTGCGRLLHFERWVRSGVHLEDHLVIHIRLLLLDLFYLICSCWWYWLLHGLGSRVLHLGWSPSWAGFLALFFCGLLLLAYLFGIY